MADFDEFRIGDTRRFIENLEDALAHTPLGRAVPGLDAVEGVDASGTVYCTVRLDARAVRIVITDGWWDAVGRHGVAGAVLQAYRFARQKTTFARAVLRRSGRTWEPPGETPHNSDFYDYSGADDLELLRVRIDRAAADMAAAMRLFDLVNSAEPREVHGSRGLFTLVVRGGVIESARLSRHDLRPADASDLALDAGETLLAARSTYAHHGNR